VVGRAVTSQVVVDRAVEGQLAEQRATRNIASIRYGQGLPLIWVEVGLRKRKGERTRPEGARRRPGEAWPRRGHKRKKVGSTASTVKKRGRGKVS
jgi:hypothetical protein